MPGGTWERSGDHPAIVVSPTKDGDCSVVMTSTTTNEVVREDGARVLRMFNVDELALGSSGELGWATVSEDAATRPDITVVCYLDSDPHFDFVVDPGVTDEPHVATRIPSRRVQDDWAYESVSAAWLGPGGWIRTVQEGLRGTFLALYKDPCVIAVPADWGGGWLMVQVRCRILLPKTLSKNVVRNDFNGLDWIPGTCLTDIVAWWCETPEFTDSSLKGPYLLVHSLEALFDPDPGSSVRFSRTGPPDTGAKLANGSIIPFRVWMGVPTAAFLGDRFYVWYVAHPNLDTSATPTQYYLDSISDASLRDYDSRGVFQHIVVKRFERQVIEDAISSVPLVQEVDWARSDALEGDMRLPIQVWMARSGAGLGLLHVVVALADEIADGLTDPNTTDGIEPTAWFADPEAHVCVNPQIVTSKGMDYRLLLLVAALADHGTDTSGTAGLGIWRLRGVEEGAWLQGTGGLAFQAVEALDFVAAPMDATGVSADRLAWSTSGSYGGPLLLDPDLVVTSDGTWRCYVGTGYNRPTTDCRPYDFYLRWIEPPDTERPCAAWDEAWTARAARTARGPQPLPGHEWPRRTLGESGPNLSTLRGNG